MIIDGPVRLAGTLTKPPGRGPFPAVLLISGSGPQDRDQTLFGHKTFLVLADFLTRRGLAVLRAAPAMDGASIAMLQGERIARAAGASNEQEAAGM